MSIETKWENNEKKVVVWVYSGRWELAEFYQAFEACNQLMGSVDYPVNVILDMSKSLSLPNGFMGAIRSLSKKPHPNLGIMAIIGANRLVQIFNDLVANIYRGKMPRRMYMVRTLEEAHNLFTERSTQPSS